MNAAAELAADGSGPARLDQAVEAARAAEKSGDLDQALANWELVRARYPDEPVGYWGAGSVLRQLQCEKEAEVVLRKGREKFPADEPIAREFSWLAHQQGNWVEAAERWALLRAFFPESFGGYFGGGTALRALRRFDDADVVYREGLSRWPNALNLLADFAASALGKGDLDEAAKRWQALRAKYPDDHESYLQQIRALRNAGLYERADAAATEALARFPRAAELLIEFARIAQQRGVPTEALKRWDLVATEFPGLAEGHVGAADALNDLGRYADAETVLQPALRMFPDVAHIGVLNAWIAHYQRNFREALNRWAKLRQRFLHLLQPYLGEIATYQSMGRIPEAAATIEQAMQLFPGNMHLAMDYARLPRHTEDWQESERRWAAVYERFGHDPAVKAGYAQSLMRTGKTQEADRLLEAAIAADLNSPVLHRAYAECAVQRRDWSCAEDRWRALVERMPDRSTGWVGLAEALRAQGRLDDSDALLAKASQSFPDNVEVELQLATNLTLRRDWPNALARWERLKLKYPQRGDILAGITQALWQARQDQGVAVSEGGVAAFEIPASLLETGASGGGEQASLLQLFMKFESVGDTCEFGIVQRRFGAEPISLLRWSNINPSNLIKGLDNQFEGVGEHETTVVEASHGEYVTRDTVYQIFSHTFTPQTSERPEKFAAQHLKRLKFLRRKLVADLATGEKILVYKCNQGLTDTQISAIHAAIRRYGEHTALLCMRLQDEGHPTGTLEEVGYGLFVGYIDRFSTVDINVDAWIDACRKVDALWTQRAELRAVSNG
jgi:tetratricopeptide (TPR) repeat protein